MKAQPRPPAARFSSFPAHRKNEIKFHRSRHAKPSIPIAVTLSAFTPEYVSMRHFKYSLRHGRKRLPLVAFHKNRIAAITHPPTKV